MHGAPWLTMNRRTDRAPVNPMDKATVFSIYPVEVNEKKVTLQPGAFQIPAGSYDKPARLLVGPSSWWRELSLEEPLLEIPVSSLLIAESIVRDFCNGMIACDMGECMPGLFFIPGDIQTFELVEKYKGILETAKRKQDNWYNKLIDEADILWARTNGNPLSISDDMRRAAVALGAQKDWAKNTGKIDLKRCVACGNLNNSNVVICPNCKIILDKERFEELGLSFAK